MIVKKIVNPKKSSSKSTRIHTLINYIFNPFSKNGHEKCTYAGARHFFAETAAGLKLEMWGLARAAVRSEDPINHYVLSFQQDEHPTEQQAIAAVDIFLAELALKEHQAAFALHQDTDNDHLHIVVNRVHPSTEKPTEINKGFDIEACHRAIARIEHEHGWKPESRRRYCVLESGDIGREHYDEPGPKITGKIADNELLFGNDSATRSAIDIAAPLLKRAKNWQEAHQQLASHGMRYEKHKKYTGGVIFIGNIGVKAGHVERLTLPKMEKKLGAYEPSLISPALHPEVFYTVKVASKNKKQRDRSDIIRRREEALQALSIRHAKERETALAGSWTGKGMALNAIRSVMADKQGAEKMALKAGYKQELSAIRKHYSSLSSLDGGMTVKHNKPSGRQAFKKGIIDGENMLEAFSYDPDNLPKDVIDLHLDYESSSLNCELSPEDDEDDFGQR